MGKGHTTFKVEYHITNNNKKKKTLNNEPKNHHGSYKLSNMKLDLLWAYGSVCTQQQLLAFLFF